MKETGVLLNELTPEAVAAIVAVAGPDARCPLVAVEIRHLGGAFRNGSNGPDAVGARDAMYSVFLLGVLMPPVAEMVPAALVGITGALAEYTSGHTFVNFHGSPTSVEDRARPWPLETYNRLLEIKRRYDPTDAFRFGHSLSAPTVARSESPIHA